MWWDFIGPCLFKQCACREDAQIAIEAALPLMGVQRPEDVARAMLRADGVDEAAIRIFEQDRSPSWLASLNRAAAILSLPHTGPPQEGARRCICSLAPCQSYHGDARGVCLYCDHYAACHAAPPSGWQEIESAPKDGRLVVLFAKESRRVNLGKWWPEGTSWVDEHGQLGGDCYTLATTGVWESGGGWFQPNEVTHWRPLPAPPHIAEEQTGVK